MIGLVDRETTRRAKKVSIDLLSGYINKNDGRVRLRAKTFPGAHKSGEALRSRVVWWLRTGEHFGQEADIHHKNGNRDDDRFANLERMEHAAHSREHNPKWRNAVELSCEHCGEKFKINKWRLSDPTRGRFCGQGCYHSHPRSMGHIAAISDGLRRAHEEGRR